MPDTCDVAYIFNPKLTVEELLATLCLEFGIACPPGTTSVKEYVDRLNAYLLEAHARGRHTVLIIDEAQNLAVDVLEQMRLLTNLETNQRKLLQIILLGQPELATMLGRPDLRQLAQRIVARYHLGPLNKAEVAAYLRHRLEVSGVAARNRQLFPDALVRTIYALTGGVPRLINVLCDRALLGAYAQGKECVDSATLKRAAREVFPAAARQRISLRWGLGLAAIAAVAAFALLAWDRHETPRAEAVAATPPATPPAPAPAPTEAPAPAQEKLIWPQEEPRSDSHARAYAALFKAWDNRYQGTDACQEALRLGLLCRNVRGSLTELRQLNRPAVLSLQDADDAGQHFYATLLKLDKDEASFAVGNSVQKLALAALAEQWSGQYFMLWRKPPEPGASFQPGGHGEAVVWLERQLALAEGQAARTDKDIRFDAAMVRRIRRFQLSQDLEPDGTVGPKTLMRLAGVGDAQAPKLLEEKSR